MAIEQDFNSKFYVITTPQGETQPDVYVLHDYRKTIDDQPCWKIQYKKATGISHEETHDPLIVLGAWVSNYLVRVSREGKSPSLLAPKKMMHIVWNGVDIKAVYGQEHFEVETKQLSLEELRRIGQEAQQKIDEWVANGGPLKGSARECRKVIRK